MLRLKDPQFTLSDALLLSDLLQLNPELAGASLTWVRLVPVAPWPVRYPSGYEPRKDIEIVFTGIRPGEKLYEELLTAGEGVNSLPTSVEEAKDILDGRII